MSYLSLGGLSDNCGWVNRENRRGTCTCLRLVPSHSWQQARLWYCFQGLHRHQTPRILLWSQALRYHGPTSAMLPATVFRAHRNYSIRQYCNILTITEPVPNIRWITSIVELEPEICIVKITPITISKSGLQNIFQMKVEKYVKLIF